MVGHFCFWGNMQNYQLYFDGSCNPNPGGEAAYGYVLYLDNIEINRGYGKIGRGGYMTDVVAEYAGLRAGLSAFIRLYAGENAEFRIYSDSKFVISQVNHHGKIRHCLDLNIIDTYLYQIESFDIPWSITWISREDNKLCDDLAKTLKTPHEYNMQA